MQVHSNTDYLNYIVKEQVAESKTAGEYDSPKGPLDGGLDLSPKLESLNLM